MLQAGRRRQPEGGRGIGGQPEQLPQPVAERGDEECPAVADRADAGVLKGGQIPAGPGWHCHQGLDRVALRRARTCAHDRAAHRVQERHVGPEEAHTHDRAHEPRALEVRVEQFLWNWAISARLSKCVPSRPTRWPSSREGRGEGPPVPGAPAVHQPVVQRPDLPLRPGPAGHPGPDCGGGVARSVRPCLSPPHPHYFDDLSFPRTNYLGDTGRCQGITTNLSTTCGGSVGSTADATVVFHGAVAARLGVHPSDHKAMSLLQQHCPVTIGENGPAHRPRRRLGHRPGRPSRGARP